MKMKFEIDPEWKNDDMVLNHVINRYRSMNYCEIAKNILCKEHVNRTRNSETNTVLA